MGPFTRACVDENIAKIASQLVNEPMREVVQFCESYGEEEDDVRYYDVYRIITSTQSYVLKKVQVRELFNYEHYLASQDFPTPHFYGKLRQQNDTWMLIEDIEGIDLRDMTDELVDDMSKQLARIQNAFWEKTSDEDDRYEVYLKRVERRGKFFEKDPLVHPAYQKFIERQKSCPLTLSHGDFILFNMIQNEKGVTIIDWGFGGRMPYSLDIARFIAHGTTTRETFPFYMTDEHKEKFVELMYERLAQKPDYEQYRKDVKLALLNEYCEFVEADEDENGWYQRHMVELAKEIATWK